MRGVADKRLSLCGTFSLVHLLAVSVILVTGCQNQGEQTHEVTGSVSYRGKSLTLGAVVLCPENGRLLDPAAIGPDGVYRLEAPAGKYRVAIISMPAFHRGEGGSQTPEVSAMPTRSLIPEHYGRPQTSGLQITVEADKPNKIDLALR